MGEGKDWPTCTNGHEPGKSIEPTPSPCRRAACHGADVSRHCNAARVTRGRCAPTTNCPNFPNCPAHVATSCRMTASTGFIVSVPARRTAKPCKGRARRGRGCLLACVFFLPGKGIGSGGAAERTGLWRQEATYTASSPWQAAAGGHAGRQAAVPAEDWPNHCRPLGYSTGPRMRTN